MSQPILPEILTLSKKLISIHSTADNPQALYDVINLVKTELNNFSIKEFDSNGKPSLLITNVDRDIKQCKIFLNAHLDVVPGNKEQFESFEKEGKLYGRGALDAKSASAVIFLLFKEFAKKIDYPLGLQIVTDEEMGGFQGTLFQVKKGYKADFILADEHTNLNIKNTAKGMVMVNITTRGQSGHSAYPWLVKNAITSMYNVMNIINHHFPQPKEEVWKTTASFINIHGGNPTILTAKIPDTCTLRVDFRVIPAEQNFLEKIKKILPPEVEIEVLTNEVSPYIPEDNSYLLLLQEKVKQITGKEASIIKGHGTSDLRHYSMINCHGIEFGPIGEGHHSDNEYVDIKSLEDYYYILKEFLLSTGDL